MTLPKSARVNIQQENLEVRDDEVVRGVLDKDTLKTVLTLYAINVSPQNYLEMLWQQQQIGDRFATYHGGPGFTVTLSDYLVPANQKA